MVVASGSLPAGTLATSESFYRQLHRITCISIWGINGFTRKLSPLLKSAKGRQRRSGDKSVTACLQVLSRHLCFYALHQTALHLSACLQCIWLLRSGNRKRLQASGSIACALGNMSPGLGAQQLSPYCDILCFVVCFSTCARVRSNSADNSSMRHHDVHIMMTTFAESAAIEGAYVNLTLTLH